jgi:hypothetical protein
MIGNKNKAIPANAFAVSPAPFSALQRLDISLKGILPHPINRVSNRPLMVSGKRTELPHGLRGESNGPG